MPQRPKIKVVIVDDSLFIRRMFCAWLDGHPLISVVGAAANPLEAREMIKQTNPDVITLDVEMPEMDGISFLEKIMRLRPTPVVMASTLTAKGADITLQALELGAVDYVTKPSAGIEGNWESALNELTNKVILASNARVNSGAPRNRPRLQEQADMAVRKTLPYHGRNDHLLIAIGASTGGVEALATILRTLPDNLPPIVITQHMPPLFTASFAKRLNKICALNVMEAVHQQAIAPGNAYIAPGGTHMKIIRKSGPKFEICLEDSVAVSGHKPSVDVLFHSIADSCKNEALGIILTGMGHDGASGLKTMRHSGATTFGQNEESCVVYGMPKAAFKAGGVSREITLNAIASAIIHHCEETS